MGSMALIVFFRGINVGGHRAFRPSVLAKELAIYDAVNVGTADRLVVRKPGLRAKFLAELRIIGSKNRLVYGVYRRHMKTIGYLGQIDRLFGAPATTRSWNTILSVLRILKSHEPGK